MMCNEINRTDGLDCLSGKSIKRKGGDHPVGQIIGTVGLIALGVLAVVGAVIGTVNYFTSRSQRNATGTSFRKAKPSTGADKQITSEDRDLLNLICDVVEVSEKSKVK